MKRFFVAIIAAIMSMVAVYFAAGFATYSGAEYECLELGETASSLAICDEQSLNNLALNESLPKAIFTFVLVFALAMFASSRTLSVSPLISKGFIGNIKAHWRGDLPLRRAFVLNWLGVNLLIWAINAWIITPAHYYERVGQETLFILVAIGVVVFIWQCVGLWRSARDTGRLINVVFVSILLALPILINGIVLALLIYATPAAVAAFIISLASGMFFIKRVGIENSPNAIPVDEGATIKKRRGNPIRHSTSSHTDCKATKKKVGDGASHSMLLETSSRNKSQFRTGQSTQNRESNYAHYKDKIILVGLAVVAAVALLFGIINKHSENSQSAISLDTQSQDSQSLANNSYGTNKRSSEKKYVRTNPSILENAKDTTEATDTFPNSNLHELKAESTLTPKQQYEKGLMFATGNGAVQDLTQATNWFREAADQGYAAAQYELGAQYGRGLGVNRNSTESLRWYSLAAEQGHAEAQFNLGLAYRLGEGVEKDESKSKDWFKQAAEQGHVEAQYMFAQTLSQGTVKNRNYAESAKWYGRAADQGHIKAQYNLGVLYDQGLGVAKDDVKAVGWYRKSALQGFAPAQYNLGFMYDSGFGITESRQDAFYWYSKAARQGHAEAEYSLGIAYEYGFGVSENRVEAARWYKKAAQQGHARAQNNLGNIYRSGNGVSKNVNEATKWYRKAADQGIAEAQHNLGTMHYMGEGFSQSFTEAVKWFKRAAEKGFSASQYNLGNMYLNGEGVQKSYVDAFQWFKKAALLGDIDAQHDIGIMLGNGIGTTKDFPQAFVWLSVAVMSGNQRSIEYRDTFASELSSNVLAGAKIQANQLHAKIDSQK